jgi:hypothetical protein
VEFAVARRALEMVDGAGEGCDGVAGEVRSLLWAKAVRLCRAMEKLVDATVGAFGPVGSDTWVSSCMPPSAAAAGESPRKRGRPAKTGNNGRPSSSVSPRPAPAKKPHVDSASTAMASPRARRSGGQTGVVSPRVC